jgi:PiT family inorganic phosphate transporter
LIAAFKAGMFLPGAPTAPVFFIAVLIGAIGWVAFATCTGLPVSTTHAIVGGLIGTGLVAFGRQQIVWAFVGNRVAMPLAISPVLSTLLVYLLAWPIVGLARRCGGRCVCVERQDVVVATIGTVAAQTTGLVAPAFNVTSGTETECAAHSPAIVITTSKVTDALHWTSGGLVSFARGWNDAPKITALSMVALTAANATHPAAVGFAIVTVAMAIGGYVSGRKVLDTLATKLTPLPLAESLTASLTTAALVSAASWASLPVSTTHVSTGAIIGAGLKNDPSAVKWHKVLEVLLSWIITLPVAGLIAAMAMWIIKMRGSVL